MLSGGAGRDRVRAEERTAMCGKLRSKFMKSEASRLTYGPSEVVVETRADGSLIVTSPHALGVYPRTMTDCIDHWALASPDATFLAERNASGDWSHTTYAAAREAARSIGAALVERGLGADRPLAILSGNSVDHALVGLGAMYAGIPYVSVSTAYSLLSNDFAKLKSCIDLLTPGAIFAANATQFARAIEAAVPSGTEVIAGTGSCGSREVSALGELLRTVPGPALDRANAAVGPDTIAKFLFTSGSTGAPKAVINTQRMLTSNQAMIARAYPSISAPRPVLVDWLPWSHTFGTNHNLGIAMMHGGVFYIDDGKPMPGAIDATVRNLRDVAPTLYFNVPKGFEMLLPALKADAELRRHFFSRLQFIFYAGAALSPSIRSEYETLSAKTLGMPLPFITALGSTETAPSALNVTAKATGPAVIGVPNAGVAMKLVPTAGKLEARLKGPNITPGYWRQPDLTSAAFDDEGYYRLGDALRFADPADPDRGFIFDGRLSEDFKLATGTWVSVGPLRAAFLAHFGPVVRDIVIAGHGRDVAAGLIVPDLDACLAMAGSMPPPRQPADILADSGVRARMGELLKSFNARAAGNSHRIARVIMLEVPPSLDSGEMTDKGTINQSAVLANRSNLVEELYAVTTSPRIIG